MSSVGFDYRYFLEHTPKGKQGQEVRSEGLVCKGCKAGPLGSGGPPGSAGRGGARLDQPGNSAQELLEPSPLPAVLATPGPGGHGGAACRGRMAGPRQRPRDGDMHELLPLCVLGAAAFTSVRHPFLLHWEVRPCVGAGAASQAAGVGLWGQLTVQGSVTKGPSGPSSAELQARVNLFLCQSPAPTPAPAPPAHSHSDQWPAGPNASQPTGCARLCCAPETCPDALPLMTSHLHLCQSRQ